MRLNVRTVALEKMLGLGLLVLVAITTYPSALELEAAVGALKQGPTRDAIRANRSPIVEEIQLLDFAMGLLGMSAIFTLSTKPTYQRRSASTIGTRLLVMISKTLLVCLLAVVLGVVWIIFFVGEAVAFTSLIGAAARDCRVVVFAAPVPVVLAGGSAWLVADLFLAIWRLSGERMKGLRGAAALLFGFSTYAYAWGGALGLLTIVS